MSRLAWQPHLRAAVLSPDQVVVLSESGHVFLRGESYAHAARCLDGRLTADAICDRLENEGVPPVTARLTLSHLHALNLVGDIKDAEAAFWHGIDSVKKKTKCKISVALRVLINANVESLRAPFEAAGLALTECDQAELLVVIAQDYLAPELEAIDGDRRLARLPWMLIKPLGVVPWIGPLFFPERTGCWHCLAQRLRLNRQTENVLETQVGEAISLPQPAAPWSIDLALRLAAFEIVRWLTVGTSTVEGTVVTLDLRSNALTRHYLTRRPQCLGCGAHADPPAVEAPFAMELSRKGGPDGRSTSSAVVWQTLRHHISPITGVVRALSETLIDGLPHVAAAHMLPLHRYDLRVLRDNLLGRSGGKGSTPLQARVGALCEALERYSGIWHGDEAVCNATQADLGDAAVDLAICLGYSERQYAERATLNDGNDDPHTWIPTPLDKNRTISWSPLWSSTKGTRFLPSAYCYFGHEEMKDFFCPSDSSGCAAGGTVTEAVAHGLLELIERDAGALWWYNQLSRPAVDVGSFDERLLHVLREAYSKRGRKLWVLDLTSDFGVPVMAAISARLDRAEEDIILGMAADFDAAAALRRALLEMHQSMYLVGEQDADEATHYRTDRPATLRWLRNATCANQPHLVADPSVPSRRRSDYCWPAHNDSSDDLHHCIGVLTAAGLEVLVLNQTRPDIRLPVVRVVVPSLCHIWPRLGKRRLYESPVRMGWLPAPKLETEMNRWPIYF